MIHHFAQVNDKLLSRGWYLCWRCIVTLIFARVAEAASSKA